MQTAVKFNSEIKTMPLGGKLIRLEKLTAVSLGREVNFNVLSNAGDNMVRFSTATYSDLPIHALGIPPSHNDRLWGLGRCADWVFFQITILSLFENI